MEKRLSEKTETKGYVHKIIKSSIVDGPGNRVAIFMQGCNFDCWYCHNPETIEMKNGGKVYTPTSLFLEIEKYFDFVDGITISGGEPLLQQEFVFELLKLIKSKYDTSCFIDTNASVEINDELIEITDYFMIDVKVVDDDEHMRLTKCSNDIVLKNLEKLLEVKKVYEVRTVVYPGYEHNNTFKYVDNITAGQITYKKIEFHTNGVR